MVNCMDVVVGFVYCVVNLEVSSVNGVIYVVINCVVVQVNVDYIIGFYQVEVYVKRIDLNLVFEFWVFYIDVFRDVFCVVFLGKDLKCCCYVFELLLMFEGM